MRKQYFTIFSIGLAVLASSCTTVRTTTTRDSYNINTFAVERKDYKITEDVTAEAEVRVNWLGGVKVDGVKYKGNEQKVGIIGGKPGSKDEQIAAYKLIEANPDFDYLELKFLK